MKFRCEREVLADALATAGRAATSRTGTLPVLSGLRLEVHGDELIVTGTDLELSIRLFEDRAAGGVSEAATMYYVGVAYALLDDAEMSVRYLERAIPMRNALNRRRAARDPDLEGIRPALTALGLVEPQPV